MHNSNRSKGPNTVGNAMRFFGPLGVGSSVPAKIDWVRTSGIADHHGHARGV